MRIAIITIHRVLNYGAVLQAFALKKALTKYGDVTTIDYRKEFLERNMNYIRFDFSFHGLKTMIHDLINFKHRYRVIEKFKRFIVKNMNLTKPTNHKKIHQTNFPIFDVYVSGSDQIWNPRIVSKDVEIDSAYFLSFATKNSKKISFASSIGNYEYDELEKEKVKELLSDFHRISTRERDGEEKLAKILPKKTIQTVVDPSLLLSNEEWINFAGDNYNIPFENYILVYTVPRTDLIKKAVDFYAKKLKLKVIAIDRSFFPITKVDLHVKDASPREFIALYQHASFVITDSFHGTCFAVNFSKPFACIAANEKANRQENLLKQLNLSERIMYKEKDFENLAIHIDFNTMNQKLELIRKESLQFIDQALT